MPLFSLPDMTERATGEYPTTVALSPFSKVLLLAAYDTLAITHNWQGAGENLTSDEIDEIQAIVALAYEELMTPLVGQISLYAGVLPENVLECDGTTYWGYDYPELFAVLDDFWKADIGTFRTPDLRGRVPLGVGQGDGLSEYTMGQIAGEEAHTLTIAEMPSHQHTDAGHQHTEGVPIAAAIPVGVGVPAPAAIPGVGVTGIASANISFEGGDSAHENRQPSIALRYGITAW